MAEPPEEGGPHFQQQHTTLSGLYSPKKATVDSKRSNRQTHPQMQHVGFGCVMIQNNQLQNTLGKTRKM